MFLVCCVLITILKLAVTDAASLTAEQGQRIIGGVKAPEAYSPHMAALLFGEPNQFVLCGGSIISKRLVLTAAHCIDEVVGEDGQLMPSFRLRVGSNQWNSGGKLIEVKTYINHPEWDPQNIINDAGILVLMEELVLDKYVAIVQLGLDFIGGGRRCLVTGWGRTGPTYEDNVINLQPTPIDLQLLHVNTISHKECQEQMAKVAGDIWTPKIHERRHICTFHSKGHGMCMGDSGSALILVETREQIGIVSWGWGCADGGPDVYVFIYGIRHFVKSTMLNYED